LREESDLRAASGGSRERWARQAGAGIGDRRQGKVEKYLGAAAAAGRGGGRGRGKEADERETEEETTTVWCWCGGFLFCFFSFGILNQF